jgi:hypothetical protein
MQTVPETTPSTAPTFVGIPLSLVFAEGSALETVRSEGQGTVPLVPPFHVSDGDAYLVLPDDIGTEVVDILRDGDLELLHETLRDSLLVRGSVQQGDEEGSMQLAVEQALSPAKALESDPDYAEQVAVGGGADPVEDLNGLEHVQCTIMSSFIDDEGLDRALRRSEYVGVSWRPSQENAEKLQGVDPTYIWSRRRPDGRVGIELTLFQEYEELVALLRPAVLAPAEQQ